MKKIAIVTGGTGGIGTAISRKLRDDNFQVIATSLHHAGNSDDCVKSKKSDIIVEPLDATDFYACEKFAEKILADYGSVSVIVNNAGITKDSQFRKMSYDQWYDVINVNLNSVFNVTRQFINPMLENGWGRIINISSINGQRGQFGQTNYSATKSAIHGFTMALAQETAAKGITVNTVSPGYTGTDMVRAIREDILEKIVADIPMKRLAEPEEIAAAVSYLCTDLAAFISGANLPVNGAQFTSF